MFNSVNNPFGQRIDSAVSTGQEKDKINKTNNKEKRKSILKVMTKTKLKLEVYLF